MVGVPAKQVGWMSEHGERMDLPLQGEASYTCPHSGCRYRLSQGHVINMGNSDAS
jgi:UDP-2-acetamido-3-amino-2,3-dideoxy-glucuronate N-acetyltransferase